MMTLLQLKATINESRPSEPAYYRFVDVGDGRVFQWNAGPKARFAMRVGGPTGQITPIARAEAERLIGSPLP